MKSMFKKGMKLAMFAPDTHGVMRFSRIVYVAKHYKGFVSISYSQGAQISENGFEIIKESNICRTTRYLTKKELRPVDETYERLEEFRIIRDNLIRSAARLEAVAKATNIETLSDLVGPQELSYFLEITDSLVKKLGDQYQARVSTTIDRS